MDTLRLVEVAGDGSLVLMTGDGRRFGLAVDEQVRSAVRRSRNGTHDAPGDGGRPGPREVQARIRAGADAVQVAAQTGLDVDYVRRFEGPVLAERAHVADLARATAVDRGGDPTLSLERVVLDVLTGEGYAVDDIRWDSRKVDGSRWQVVVTSREGVARSEATWGFDVATRALEPVDAEAERLTGVERRRRLSAVRDSVFDVERPAPAPVGRGGTVELLDALARQRGRRPVARPAGTAEAGEAPDAGGDAPRADALTPGPTAPAAADPAAPPADDHRPGHDPAAPTADRPEEADRSAPVAAPQVAAPHVPAGRADRPAGLRVVAARRTDGHTEAAGRDGTGRGSTARDQAELSIEPDLLTELELDGPPARSTRSGHLPDGSVPEAQPVAREPQPVAAAAGERRGRRRRAAVPSWDEIVFGSRREDG